MALGKGLGSLIPPKKTEQSSSNPAVSKNSLGTVLPQEKKMLHTQSATNSESSFAVNTGTLLVAVSKIVPNSKQPRRSFPESELAELAASIKEHGIIQPLAVAALDNGTYELIAGERRFRAAQKAGLREVPIVVKEGTEQEKFEWALIENIQRQDLNPVEEAYAYQRLMDEFHLTQQDIAERVGKSRSAVANMVRLLQLPEEIHTALIDRTLSMGKARALLGLKDSASQLDMFRSMMGEKVSVRDVERAVQKTAPQKRVALVRRDPNIAAHEQALEDALNTKVRVTQRGEAGTIVLHYYSLEELRKLINKLRQEDDREL